jgi:hypothetical protein
MFGNVAPISIAARQGDVEAADQLVSWVCEESDSLGAQRPSHERLGLTSQVAALLNGTPIELVRSGDHCKDCRHVEFGKVGVAGGRAPEDSVKLGVVLAVLAGSDLETAGVVRLSHLRKLTSERVAEGWRLSRWNSWSQGWSLGR